MIRHVAVGHKVAEKEIVLRSFQSLLWNLQSVIYKAQEQHMVQNWTFSFFLDIYNSISLHSGRLASLIRGR
jgi:hypothetical protein